MIEFWAVLGLACIDHEFRNKLRQDPEHTVAAYRFRLSRFEMGEVQRLVKSTKVVNCMEEIEVVGWGKICATGMTHNAGYVHPGPEVFERLQQPKQEK